MSTAETAVPRTQALPPNVGASEAVYSKVSWRIIPLLLIAYMIAYLDRINIGYAQLQMKQTLPFGDAVYGIGAGIRARADSLKRRLTAIEEQIYQTKNRSNQDPLNFPIRLNNRIAALAGVVAAADARPTDQALQVFDRLSQELQAQLDRLRQVVETDVPAFNTLVREANVPALNVRER